jgi:cytochrome oxidase Cu insertion factor (SCO1/SenC/PrrC family)
LLGLLALLTVLVGVGVGVGVRLLTRSSPAPAVIVTSRHGLDGQATWAAGAKAAPAINTLRDQTGRPFSLTSLHGRTVAIVFFDSHCHQECPLEGRALATAERALPRAQRPVLVAVSVNPLDTRASVRQAVHSWGLASVAPWHWLMGTRTELAGVWKPYHIYVAPHPVDGDISHTEAVYLIDRRGFERAAYLFPFVTRFVTHDLRALAGRSGE